MERNYKKDPKTGAVVFQDADAYAKRKKILASQKIAKANEKDGRKVINSLRSEVNELKELVAKLIDNPPGE